MAAKTSTATTPVTGDPTSQVDAPENSAASGGPALSPIEADAEAARLAALADAPSPEAVAAEATVQQAASEVVAASALAQSILRGPVRAEDISAGVEISKIPPLSDAQASGLSAAEAVQLIQDPNPEDVPGQLVWDSSKSGWDPARVSHAQVSNLSVGNTPVGSDPARLTATRNSTHGDYDVMSKITMDLMRVYEATDNWDSLPDGVKVFFFNVAQKSARALCGNPLEPDHYDDVAGYAYLASKTVKKTS